MAGHSLLPIFAYRGRSCLPLCFRNTLNSDLFCKYFEKERRALSVRFPELHHRILIGFSERAPSLPYLIDRGDFLGQAYSVGQGGPSGPSNHFWLVTD